MMMQENKFDAIQVGDEAEIFHTITTQDIDAFIDLTGDNNPLHTDIEFASKTNFRKPVVHGMLTASFISTIIGTKLPGPGALWYEQKLRFLNPARVGNKICVFVKVLHKSNAQKTLVLQTNVFDENKRILIEGEAKVRNLDKENVLVDNKENKEERKESLGKDNLIDDSKIKGAIIVSGASKGIGAVIAKNLAITGYPVIINYLNSVDSAESLVKDINDFGGRAIAIKADVSKMSEVKDMIAQTISTYKNIIGIVNNASAPIDAKDFINYEWNDIQKQINVQLKGSFNITKTVLPLFLNQKYGVIVNIASTVADHIPPAKWLPYNMVKSALITSTKTLANEYGPNGIRANCVSPGMTNTDLIADIPDKIKMISKMQTPLRRLTQPEDVAKTVAFLFSPESSFITGQNIRVSGGSIM